MKCGNGKLTNLDVSNNTALKTLDCNYNNLTKLDVTKNAALSTFNCEFNNLTSLDVSTNGRLWALMGNNNPWTSVQMGGNSSWGHRALNPLYTVTMEPGISKIPFSALPQGFDKNKIQGEVIGGRLEDDGFN